MGCFVFILFFGFFIFLAILINILRLVFGVRQAARRFMGDAPHQQKNAEEKQTQYRAKPNAPNPPKHFAKDEGEYIDFEEVK